MSHCNQRFVEAIQLLWLYLPMLRTKC